MANPTCSCGVFGNGSNFIFITSILVGIVPDSHCYNFDRCCCESVSYKSIHWNRISMLLSYSIATACRTISFCWQFYPSDKFWCMKELTIINNSQHTQYSLQNFDWCGSRIGNKSTWSKHRTQGIQILVSINFLLFSSSYMHFVESFASPSAHTYFFFILFFFNQQYMLYDTLIPFLF